MNTVNNVTTDKDVVAVHGEQQVELCRKIQEMRELVEVLRGNDPGSDSEEESRLYEEMEEKLAWWLSQVVYHAPLVVVGAMLKD